MSSLHHLPKEDVESKVWSNSSAELTDSLIDDFEPINEVNGRAFGQYFETIDILSDETVIIASDNLQGLSQYGYITKYESKEDVPHLPILSLSPGYGGICNAIPLRDKTMICGFDSGHISKLSEGLEELITVTLHDNQICKLSVDRLETKSMSGGYDKSLVLLDLNTFNPIKSYPSAHSATIWDNNFNKFDDNLVLSCSRDKDVLLWDLRKQRPASRILTVETEPTAVCWSSKDLSNCFIGTDSGQIFLLDIRNPKPEAMGLLSNRVYRIKNAFNGKAIAICSDDNTFSVLDSKTLTSIYSDNTSHKGWVRDVTEHNHLLYTVGRDSRLICHSNVNPNFESIEMSDTSAVN